MNTVVKDSEKARTEMRFLGKPLVLDCKYPIGEIHMHPETIFQITGRRPEGSTDASGQWTILKTGGL